LEQRDTLYAALNDMITIKPSELRRQNFQTEKNEKTACAVQDSNHQLVFAQSHVTPSYARNKRGTT
jgi:hypothetical protein